MEKALTRQQQRRDYKGELAQCKRELESWEWKRMSRRERVQQGQREKEEKKQHLLQKEQDKQLGWRDRDQEVEQEGIQWKEQRPWSWRGKLKQQQGGRSWTNGMNMSGGVENQQGPSNYITYGKGNTGEKGGR